MLTKKQQTALKHDKKAFVFGAIMRFLENSHLYESNLWPKHGFIAGWEAGKNRVGNYNSDTICINVMTEWNLMDGRIRFNLWNKSEARIEKQFDQLNIIFENAFTENILFEFADPETYDFLGMHDEILGCSMGMLNLRFTIQGDIQF